MSIGNSATSWGWLARLFHWLMAVLIVGMLGFGIYLVQAYNPGDPAKLELVQIHKSFGFVVFALVCLRLIWRAVNPTPKLPATMSPLMQLGAKFGHWILYLLMFAMPITGWLASSASPYNDADAYPMQIKNMVFGLFEMPDPFATGSHALSDQFMTAHFYVSLALLAVLAVHVIAAIKHAAVDRDGVMERMIRG